MEDLYEVERIVGKKLKGSEYQYLVKWNGYSFKESTWEKMKNLQSVANLVLQFDSDISTKDLPYLDEVYRKGLKNQEKSKKKCKIEKQSKKDNGFREDINPKYLVKNESESSISLDKEDSECSKTKRQKIQISDSATTIYEEKQLLSHNSQLISEPLEFIQYRDIQVLSSSNEENSQKIEKGSEEVKKHDYKISEMGQMVCSGNQDKDQTSREEQDCPNLITGFKYLKTIQKPTIFDSQNVYQVTLLNGRKREINSAQLSLKYTKQYFEFLESKIKWN